MSIDKIADLLQQIVNELRNIAPPQPAGPNLPLLNKERIARLKQMASSNDKVWQDILALANQTKASKPYYDDEGQRAGLVYVVTGDKEMGTAAATQLLKALDAETGDTNSIREGFINYMDVYFWVQDVMTDAQKADFLKGMQTFADISISAWRVADSDQLIGQYFGLLLMDAAKLGGGNLLNSTIKTGYDAGKTVGGFDGVGKYRATVRDTLREYITVHAKGGDWFESGMYNSNTLVLLITGWLSAWDVLGVDHFPEIAAFIPDACDCILTTITPDLLYRMEWGDEQHDTQLMTYKQLCVLAVLQGAAMRLGLTEKTGKLGDLYNKIQAKYPDVKPRDRAYFFLDSAIPTSPYYDGKFLATYSQGAGQLRRFNKNNVFMAICEGRTNIDHEVTITDITLYRNGEFQLWHPIDYHIFTDMGQGTNSILYYGISGMEQKGVIDGESTVDYSAIVMQTNGPIDDATAWNLPPEFLHEGTRTAFYLAESDAIVVCDRINIKNPKVDRPDLSGYLRPDITEINAALARSGGRCFEQLWHQPIEPTLQDNVIKWTTNKGNIVQVEAFSTTGALLAEKIDEKVFWQDIQGISADQKKWQTRFHPAVDANWNTIITLIRFDDGSPATIINKGNIAGWSFGTHTVLFGTDINSRLIDPATAPTNAYLVGCKNKLVVKN